MENIPAFIDAEPQQQVAEMRAFLRAKGADISEEIKTDFVTDLGQVIKASEVLWREGTKEGGTDQEIEGVNNSIIYLLLIIPADQNQGLISAFCDKLTDPETGDKRNALRLRLLNNLFTGLNKRSSHRYIAYMAILKLGSQADMMSIVDPNIDQIKKWFSEWNISTNRVQTLWRRLHDAFQESKHKEKSTKVMVELLSTYTSDNASQAREDAHKCIVTCLADPDTYLMDHLLALKPVKFLEGELTHNLLTIFVSGKLGHYISFYEEHSEFVKSLGLSHEDNLQKMKLLTFMQMAETSEVIDFDTIQQELQLTEDEVESFIIDVVGTKAVFAKIDQIQRKVIISVTTHRTFGRQQWQLLREKLYTWQTRVDQCLVSLQSIQHH